MSTQSMAIKSKRISKPARRSSRSSSAAKYLAQPVVKPTRNLPIQAKLTIGQPNDKYEQEADRVSDQVMRMSDVDVAQRVESGTVQPMRIQRMCPECEEEQSLQRQPEEEEEELQAKEMPGQTPTVAPNLESRINSLKGGGQPLDSDTRSFFEPRFGHNFSGVRMHTDGAAADTAKSIHARAFTLGNHVVMGEGFQPKSNSGQHLLGHELTHVIQQSKDRKFDKLKEEESIEPSLIDTTETIQCLGVEEAALAVTIVQNILSTAGGGSDLAITVDEMNGIFLGRKIKSMSGVTQDYVTTRKAEQFTFLLESLAFREDLIRVTVIMDYEVGPFGVGNISFSLVDAHDASAGWGGQFVFNLTKRDSSPVGEVTLTVNFDVSGWVGSASGSFNYLIGPYSDIKLTRSSGDVNGYSSMNESHAATQGS